MCKSYAMTGFAMLLALLAGCATQQQMLDQQQDKAVQTVSARARFEMNCPGAQSVILSREVTQPAITAPRLNYVERMEYTIGFDGCGQRKTYVVICPEGGEGCFAADGRR